MSLLAQRLLAIHDSLSEAGLAHAFGGAIALAYCTEEPRGTRDLDVNVFAAPQHAAAVLAELPPQVAVGEKDIETARSEGQVRVWWEDTPVDLFLDVHSFHDQVAAGIRQVPFLKRSIPVLDCTSLAVFKALFDRSRDWADIEDMVAAGTLDVTRTRDWLVRFQGEEGPAVRKLESLARL